MSNKDELAKEICELLLIWERLNTTVWSEAKTALEHRINQLCGEAGFDDGGVLEEDELPF